MNSDKPISRQLKWQRKLKSEGKCQSCARPAEESPRGGFRALCIACALRVNPNAKPHHPRSVWEKVDWSKKNKEIAKEMNVTLGTAVRWRRKIIGSSNKIKWNDLDWTKSNAVLAKELNRTMANVANWRNKCAPIELRSTMWRRKNCV